MVREPQSMEFVTIDGDKFPRSVRDEAGTSTAEHDKVEEIAVEMRPVLRGFRYGGNIRLSLAPTLNNCDALEVYVDDRWFTLYPGSDIEVPPGATVRMEVKAKARGLASLQSGICTFYGKPSTL
jgi:hypothetical protein